jgi:hypothetical protein
MPLDGWAPERGGESPTMLTRQKWMLPLNMECVVQRVFVNGFDVCLKCCVVTNEEVQ